MTQSNEMGERWEGWVRPYSVDILEALGFEDSTFVHDSCPSWTLGEQGREELAVQIFIDFPPELSESAPTIKEWAQYVLYDGDDAMEGKGASLVTDDFGEVLRHLNFKHYPKEAIDHEFLKTGVAYVGRFTFGIS